MIGDGSQEIKSLTSMIGKTIIKLVWIFLELDLISKLKPVRTYLLTGFNMKNKFSPENVLIRIEVILSIFLKYTFYVFIVMYFYHYSIITTVFQIFIIALLL